jgi:hypothetical protein
MNSSSFSFPRKFLFSLSFLWDNFEYVKYFGWHFFVVVVDSTLKISSHSPGLKVSYEYSPNSLSALSLYVRNHFCLDAFRIVSLFFKRWVIVYFGKNFFWILNGGILKNYCCAGGTL